MPQEVKPEDLKDHVGEFMIFRTETETENRVAKLLEVNSSENKWKYEVITGKDKGCKFESKFLPQKITMYDQDTAMLALVSI